MMLTDANKLYIINKTGKFTIKCIFLGYIETNREQEKTHL